MDFKALAIVCFPITVLLAWPLKECLVGRASRVMLVLNSTAKFFLGLDLKGSLGFLRML